MEILHQISENAKQVNFCFEVMQWAKKGTPCSSNSLCKAKKNAERGSMMLDVERPNADPGRGESYGSRCARGSS